MQIMINKYNWNMDYVDDDKISMNNADGVNLGLTEYLLQQISIRRNMSEEMTYSTVIHELCHAFLFSYGMNTSNYDNEQVCNFFGAYGADIMNIANEFMKEGCAGCLQKTK